MIVMTVQGVSDSYGKRRLLKLCSTLCGLVQGELYIRCGVRRVSAFFPPDLLQGGLGEEIIATVENFTGRTICLEPYLRERIEGLIKDKIAWYFPDAKFIGAKVNF